ELSSLQNALPEMWPERVRREKQGEERVRPKFGTGRHGADRLGGYGRPEIQQVAPEEGKVVGGCFVSPLKAELRRVRRRQGAFKG
ncbi:MAG: hypothetical protein NT069_32905, partial [Planctomycetota bacterium]|nr:hypothetical protein [Planctomycetota bacterium]